jgi:putative hydrolase of the HAD superfamily
VSDAPAAPPRPFPRPLRAVLFDLDDTLYPEHAFVDGGFRAVAAFLAPVLSRPQEALAARLWSLHARDGRGRLFDTLLAEHGVSGDPDLVLACLLVYRTHRPRLEPFPGAADAIEAIAAAGASLGIVSDGNAGVQRRKLAGLGQLADRFGVVVMTDELGPRLAKPSPVPFRVACRLLGVPAAEAAYVANDPRKDFRGARAAGLATVRIGLLPDEGGGPAIPIAAADDADIAIESFPLLTATLAPAIASPHTR